MVLPVTVIAVQAPEVQVSRGGGEQGVVAAAFTVEAGTLIDVPFLKT